MLSDIPTRSQLAPGDFVEIEIYNRGNKSKHTGEIESILTNVETHTHGIMVALKTKKIGRVKKKISAPTKPSLDDNNPKEIHDNVSRWWADDDTLDKWKKEGRFLPFDEIKEKMRMLTKQRNDMVHGVGGYSEPKFFSKDQIPTNEDNYNEFKESFKADTVCDKLIASGNKKGAEGRKQSSKNYEHDVMKEVSIAASAFANCEGGRLFIGVADDPVEVVGLEPDRKHFKNNDEYIRAITDSIISFTKDENFGQKIGFQFGEDEMFLVLHVPPQEREPIFMHEKNKEEFYVRLYGESRLYQHTDMRKFCKDRFPNW